MIITIDGPAAAGKSTVARQLADELGFDYLDTGATYRAVTWKAIQNDADLHEPAELSQIAAETDIRFVQSSGDQKVLCDSKDVSEEIRTPEVTRNIRYLADEPEVRKALIEMQRDYAEERDVVTEGRDQGTEVFPDAEVKFYLDASPETRARRRLKEMQAKNVNKDFEEMLVAIRERDQQDQNRDMGGLKKDDDMIVVDSTDLPVQEVVDTMRALVREKTDSDNQKAPTERAHA